MKKLFSAFMGLLLIGLSITGIAAAAMNKDLNNWYGIRATGPGEHYLMDKYYNPEIHGDEKENDGIIRSFVLVAEGFNSATDKLFVSYDDGPDKPISLGTTTTSGSPHKISVKLVRSAAAAPVMVKLTKLTVDDASAPDQIVYTYTANVPADWTGDIDLLHDVDANHYYVPDKDEYRVDYEKLSGVTHYELHYLDSSGRTLYKRDYNQPPTGIHWLTCNGIYELRYFDSNGTMIGKTKKMPTSEIKQPKCASNSEDDDTGGGDNGNGGEDGGCGDVCKKLRETLACPEWDTYMGELTDMIRGAFDWDDIASKFLKKFADYWGDVPAPPTKAVIKANVRPDIPGIDTSVPDANIKPAAPDDFKDGAMEYDITKGPVISVEDGSQAIEIYEPDKFMKADGPPGTMVYPKDPKNSSNGIKEPDRPNTGTVMPEPTAPNNGPPPAEMPKPGGGIDDPPPVPNPTTGPPPTPSDNGDFVIPIPKGGGTK
ncbi:hypothetical protein [Paenibacillus sp. GCM10027626]|uniref:hypothetical protein n=1 Tax=Paenibacillus sp. GCM10027626 TaxID=3273411 RepID=UPI003644CCD7